MLPGESESLHRPQTPPPFRPLRIHVFQHVPFEGLGSMAPWMESRGHRISFGRPYSGKDFVSGADGADWIIAMGGPMGVHDGDRLPWLRDEKLALERALKRDAAVLGVCLGAQLLADVLGAKVGRNREREIGWFPVDLDSEARATWLGSVFPPRFTPFHWHGDTFALPAGAVRLGRSQACADQGFLYGDRAVGLQFHPEVTGTGLADLIANCGSELPAAGTSGTRFVQDADALRAGLGNAPALNAMTDHLCLAMENRAGCV